MTTSAQQLLMMFIKDEYAQGRTTKETVKEMMEFTAQDDELMKHICVSDWDSVLKHKGKE